MATRLFSTLVNRMASSVPGCPQPVVVTHVRDAAIEVCERTLAWRYEQDDIRLTPGVVDYEWEVPTGTEVHAVITAASNGTTIISKTLEFVHDNYPNYPDPVTTERGTPQYITHVDPDTFYVVPPPNSDTTYDIKMFVALKPLRTATGMDKSILDDIETVVMHAALQSILVIPEQTWTDRELAAYHAKQYAFKGAERRARTNLGSGRSAMTVRANPLA